MRNSLIYADETISTLREPFIVLDESLRVRSANASFYETFRVDQARTEGQFLQDLGNGQWNLTSLLSKLQSVTLAVDLHDFEVEHNFPNIGRRKMILNARRFPQGSANAGMMLLAIEDVTDRSLIERALKDSELRYRRLFQTAKDGILILDAKTGQISDSNPFMSGLLGYEHDEFLGKELWQIGLFQDKQENQLAYRELREKCYIRYDHLPLKTKSGCEVHVEFVSNVYSVNDEPTVQCNIRDISERIRFEREALEQAKSLSDLHRRKDEFLAMLAHELRNPLSPIINATHLLRYQAGESAIRQAREVIERQVKQLTRIVDDLLEISRISTGRVRLEPHRLDIRSVVDHAVESVKPLIDRRRHRLFVSTPRKPIWLHADSTRIEQVVVNLLNNAAKYTDEGGRIWLNVLEDGDEMLLTVRDTGMGIAPEMLRNVFELFSQAERSLDRSLGGLGIGLSLVKHLVEMHQGTVDARSPGLGCGSEFTVRLPILFTPEIGALEVAPEPVDQVSQGWRVLVVDDNEDSAEIFSKLLRRSGHLVQTAYTGPIALDTAEHFLPDAVLVDIGLPGINGYEVARRVRLIPGLSGVKLIAMTGYGQDTDRQLAYEAGFDSHLTKPVDFMKVQAVLATLLPASCAQVAVGIDGGDHNGLASITID